MGFAVIYIKNQRYIFITDELYQYLKAFSSSHEDIFTGTAVSTYCEINRPENYEQSRRILCTTKINFRLNENFSLKNLYELLLSFFSEKKCEKDKKYSDIKCENFSDLAKLFEIKPLNIAVNLGVL